MRLARTTRRCLFAWLTAAIAITPVLEAAASAAGEPGSQPSPAAVPEAGIALAPLELEGDEDATWQDALSDALGRGLERAGIQPIRLPATDTPCDALCWAERARAQNQVIVVRARVIARARLYEVVLEARDATDGAVVLDSTQPCAPCGRAEVESQVERQAAALGDRLVRLDLAPATLVVDSQPSGAEITLDGVLVGVTPLEVPMPAGPHRVEARRSGHEPRTRELTAVRGVTERWSVTLPAIGTVVDPPRPRARVREPLFPTGWALTGVGVPTLALGLAFVAIDEQPYRSRCSGADFDPDQNLCRYRWSSLVQGAVLTAVGGAMSITGVTLVAIGHRRRTRARTGAPTPQRPSTRVVGAFGAGTAGVRIIGRF